MSIDRSGNKTIKARLRRSISVALGIADNVPDLFQNRCALLTSGSGNTGGFTGETEALRIRVLQSRLVSGVRRQLLEELLKIHKG
jgi:hypothetical protein